MTADGRLVAVGRLGRPHGRDGSFWVDAAIPGTAGAPPGGPLSVGAELVVAGRRMRVERSAGTGERPLLRLDAVADRAQAAALRGERLLAAEADAPLGASEWLVEDLVGAQVEGLGEVRGVLRGPSCDVLEVGDGELLVPLVSDAIRRVDPHAGLIEVDRRFLGLDQEHDAGPPPADATARGRARGRAR